MNQYYIAHDKIDLKCYPNYSFEIGDVDGDGRMEFVSLDQSGNLLRVVNLENDLLFEKKFSNNGNWGTPLLCTADINGDGRNEIIVPDGNKLIALDCKGGVVLERTFTEALKDDYGICIPLLGTVRLTTDNGPSFIAAVAGGEVYLLDDKFNTIKKLNGLRHDFGHELHFADIDKDGFDEIAFCTVDHINEEFSNKNNGELVLLDHDGKIILRKRVDDFLVDTHFDDIAMADFNGSGTTQILAEKGFLMDLKGNVIWDLSAEMEHGQWIAHAPNPDGKGRLGFISELWGDNMKNLFFTGQGKKIRDIKGYPWPKPTEPGMTIRPSRCHAVNFGSGNEIFVTQQIHMKNEFNCAKTRPIELIGLFMDLYGNLIGELPFENAQIAGYYYNGETHSKAADVDGDGRQEIVFVKQDGHVMIIKKR